MKEKHHGIHHTHVEHHKDGSHTVKHVMEDGSEHPGSGAVSDLDGLHDKLEQNLGAPNPGEAAAAAGPSPAAPAGVMPPGA